MDYKEIYTASKFYKEKFGCKVYKIALDAGCTCPNRDGSKGFGGCIFCSESGSGDFAAEKDCTIKEQIIQAKKLIAPKLKQNKNVKYIAYFQNFTSTYGNTDNLIKKYEEALSAADDIAGISIGTRPDCISKKILEFLNEISKKYFVSLELGLQTSNENTGKYINRCYTNEDFIQAVEFIKKEAPEIHIISHVIFGLPAESEKDMLNTVKFCINAKVDGIKFTVLHVLKNTRLEEIYLNLKNEKQEFKCLSMDNYFDLLYKAIKMLPENIVIHRLTGDGPKSLLIAPLWTADKKNVHNQMKRFFCERGFVL